MPTLLTNLHLDKYNKKHLGIVFLVGVLLMVIAMPTSSSEESQEMMVLETSEESLTSVESTEWAYKKAMEEQLISILSKVEGVGSVDVMITLQSTTEKLVEKDVYTSTENIEEVTVYGETTIGESPYIYQEIYPVIEGVVVTASGGDNAVVIQNIKEAIQALFDVDTHKIKIMKMIAD